MFHITGINFKNLKIIDDENNERKTNSNKTATEVTLRSTIPFKTKFKPSF